MLKIFFNPESKMMNTCENCNENSFKPCEVLVHYLTSRALSQQTNWENSLMQNNHSQTFSCGNCGLGQCTVNNVAVSTPCVLFVEFSANERFFQRLKPAITFGNDRFQLWQPKMAKNLLAVVSTPPDFHDFLASGLSKILSHSSRTSVRSSAG